MATTVAAFYHSVLGLKHLCDSVHAAQTFESRKASSSLSRLTKEA
jgi:hypothetical protein